MNYDHGQIRPVYDCSPEQYQTGECVDGGNNGGTGGSSLFNSDSNNDNNQASERDWSSICNKISFALVSSCSDLVDSDNTLTAEGMHVRNCIQNGALLAGGAILLGTPPTTVLSLLPFAAKLGGCENVINFNAVTLGQLKNFGSLLR
jgi:hypothetical protein